MHSYTASVVGTGKGGRLSIKGLTGSDRFKLMAVADTSEEARAAIREDYPDVKVFESAERMFAECPTDVVCVSTYAPTHRPIALAAMESGAKGLLVEKPIGDTAAAGREVLDAARRKNLPLVVPHGLLVADHAGEILRRVCSREIGRPVLIEIESSKWDIINAGIHWINFALALTGNEPVSSVQAVCDTSTRTYRDGMQVETEAITYVQTQSGVRFVMQTGDDVVPSREGKKTLFRIVGTGGMIEFWAWEKAYRIQNAEYPDGSLIEVPPQDSAGGHQRHLQNLARQMDAGTCEWSVPESALMALEVCEAAYLSNRHRCRVDFPLEQFRPPTPTEWDPGRAYSGTGGGRDGKKL